MDDDQIDIFQNGDLIVFRYRQDGAHFGLLFFFFQNITILLQFVMQGPVNTELNRSI